MKPSFPATATQFFVTHALKFMFIGMAVAGISFFLFMRYFTPIRDVFFGFAVAGFVTYFLGRVAYAYSRRKDRRAQRDATKTSDEAENHQ